MLKLIITASMLLANLLCEAQVSAAKPKASFTQAGRGCSMATAFTDFKNTNSMALTAGLALSHNRQPPNETVMNCNEDRKNEYENHN